ncbi:MAG: F0F1 ATP synthase subunit A [Alphaproteobacteria bacterium]|nr:F0F1 ATP synthase subunit A [Alphaproteobacteria bacterium]MCD8526035.1 F0F1 ATP synthase subunit A [Alphaproteobacteria bacterium]MCD8570609.1 F0F1 ATP synthase subunit A [Alphaproteobacteria bacterium]
MADPIHQFQIFPIIPLYVGDMDLSFTNSSLWMTIAAVTSCTFLILATQKKALVPGRMQAFAEILYEFVASMIRENTGAEGRRYFPVIFTIFMIVLMGNVLGLIPYSFTYTSHIIVTGVLALLIFAMVTVLGFVNHGTHFLSLFSPPGVPFALKLFIVPIEVLSFIIRPVTLSVRLFANMLAGHLMLKVFAGFSTMLAAVGFGGVLAGFVPMIFNVALYALELLVALMQAYIFAILSSIYLKDTLDLHH